MQTEELTNDKLLELKLKANNARKLTLTMLNEAGSGHTAGPLGMADIFTALYFYVLKHNPKEPDWPDRDRLILSNGHICPIRYTLMSMCGYFPQEELKTLRKLNSRLQGHPHRTSLSGLETTSGPLGEGLSQGIGISLTAKLDNKDYKTFVITSDGEHQEGNTWEAAMFAGKMKLNNLIQIIDRNNIQIDGNTENVMPLEPLKEKYLSFGWEVLEVDGNDIKAFIDTVRQSQSIQNKPICIIAHTTPGKGVSFMENDFNWHGKSPKNEELEKALLELKELENNLS